MKDFTTYFLSFIKSSKNCLLVITILVVVMSIQITAIGDASAAYINFNEYPLDTVITDQYQSLGIVFSGEYEQPRIQPTHFDSQNPALLMGLETSSSVSRSLTFTFVNPNDGTPSEATNVSFYPSVYAYLGSLFVFTFYDINGAIISQQEFNMYDEFIFDVPPKFHKFVWTLNSGAGWIDNLYFQLVCIDIDADGDGHYTPSSCLYPHDDCDDNDPTVPGTDGEICGDGKDNDCDGYVDCLDFDCATDLVCFPASLFRFRRGPKY